MTACPLCRKEFKWNPHHGSGVCTKPMLAIVVENDAPEVAFKPGVRPRLYVVQGDEWPERFRSTKRFRFRSK